MKKVLLFFALAVMCAGATLGQGKPRVAVYVTGDDKGAKKVVAAKLISAVSVSEEYLGVERQDNFLAELDKEHAYQRSGAVDDKHIIDVGRKWGANFVCIAEASKVYGSTFISARLVRVISGEIAATADGGKKVDGYEDLDDIAVDVAERLFSVTLPKTSSGGASGRAAASLRIGGVTWAACNVDDYQVFASRPDMYTKLYQWNRSRAWSATVKEVSGWNTNEDRASAWAINPCPTGWRLPTQKEFEALHNAGTTWVSANERGNAVAGRFYGAKHETCSLPSNMENCVFLPAVGYRISGRALSSQGRGGNYWSATEGRSNNGYNLYFGSTYSSPDYNFDKAIGLSVRCVR